MYNPQLETFIRAADLGSFNKAAEELFVTPTAVIKQINLLEENLGIKLFERTHRGLKLTKAGALMYRDAKYVINYCRESILRAKNAELDDSSVIRIGTSPMTPAEALSKYFVKFRELAPNMKIQLVPFENTPENAREILANLGKNIDVVAGIFDDMMLELRQCDGFEISREPLCCAVSIHHRLADKDELSVNDLYGENLMLMRRGWSRYVDRLRDDLWQNHPKINIVDFDFYNLDIFNRCESGNDILMAINNWANVHPLLKIIPVKWEHSIPFGLLHSKEPSDNVQKILSIFKSQPI
ncbi:MAG: LysR family transcriptional regulator [Bacteroides sp.]|nr:LysR family transcriptional regulator [[Eubacterium] siraeum]MCM1463679.1 LysR family transcriptional regulator [Bacteroides sp.]